MRRRLRATLGIGVVSFVGPFVVASLVAFFVLDWSTRASLIAGTALSTTSLAVVYSVLVERGLTETQIGNLLMCATFLTDLFRVADPDDVAHVISFLCSESARHITGQTIVVDGGLSLE